MALPEVISIREDEIKQKKTDIVSPYLTYIGRADFFALASEPKWQILRKTIVAGVESIDYADYTLINGGTRHRKGEYAFVWDDRSAYFPAFTNPLAFTTDIKDMPLANTEYNYTSAPGTTEIWLKSREEGLIKVGEVLGFTNVYWTLFPGHVFKHKVDRLITFYFQSPKPNQTLEILSWS